MRKKPIYKGAGQAQRFQGWNGPFGEPLRRTGPKVDELAYGFSTKPLDESGLYYYGFRFFDPETGRWISRDPIEEEGGPNLYGFVGNDGVNTWDYLGLQFPGVPSGVTNVEAWARGNSIAPPEPLPPYPHEASCDVVGEISYDGFIFSPTNSIQVPTEIDITISVAGHSHVTGGIDDGEVVTVGAGTHNLGYINGQANVRSGVACSRKFTCKATCKTECCGSYEEDAGEFWVQGRIISRYNQALNSWEGGECFVNPGSEMAQKNACEQAAQGKCK